MKSARIYVPRVTVADLIAWLQDQPSSPAVLQVTFQVGINSCKTSAVTSAAWSGLMTELKRVFPRASLTGSSILPAKGRNPLNSIQLTNENLNKFCGRHGVKCTNHDELFIAPSGAPRLALYKDTLHPSPKGTARLAENLCNKGRERRKYPRDGYDRPDRHRQDHYSCNQSQKKHHRTPTSVVTFRVP